MNMIKMQVYIEINIISSWKDYIFKVKNGKYKIDKNV